MESVGHAERHRVWRIRLDVLVGIGKYDTTGWLSLPAVFTTVAFSLLGGVVDLSGGYPKAEADAFDRLQCVISVA